MDRPPTQRQQIDKQKRTFIKRDHPFAHPMPQFTNQGQSTQFSSKSRDDVHWSVHPPDFGGLTTEPISASTSHEPLTRSTSDVLDIDSSLSPPIFPIDKDQHVHKHDIFQMINTLQRTQTSLLQITERHQEILNNLEDQVQKIWGVIT